MAALIISPALPFISGPLPRDVNGDSVFNVSDLQHLVSQILTSRANSEKVSSDVNADGRVDILDLQAMLSETQPVPIHPSSPSNEPRHSAIVSTDNEWFSFRAETRSPVASIYEEANPLRLSCWQEAHRTDRFPLLKRYTFSLTPHAPPCFL